jgi:hypothetical protein
VASPGFQGSQSDQPIIYTSCHILHLRWFFASEAHDIARGFSPRVSGEVILSAAYLFEQLGVEDVRRFSFSVDRINPFEGETTRFVVDYDIRKKGEG